MSKTTGFDKIYDVSAKEREVIEWRAQRRLALRNEYLKEMHSPEPRYEGHIFDPNMQRYYSTHYSLETLFKPKVKNFLWYTGLLIGTIGALTYYVGKDRDEKEHRYRTGQVSYRDRDWKFV